MNRYNLVDEKWISVITLEGNNKEVSLKDLFMNAQNYHSLAGETETQNFAVLRLLLAVTQTIFSRYDAEGKPLDTIEINDMMQQVKDVNEARFGEHEDYLYKTWDDLWDKGKFPDIISKYLECWYDSFFLFSDQNPFYQVTPEVLTSYPFKKGGQKPTQIYAKQINRVISESGNKTALFSPKSESDNNKDLITAEELIRWMVTFQGYTGTSDKRVYKIAEEETGSKGWLYDIGGIYLTGENLFETLILNTILDHPEEQYNFKIQKPCWEYSDQQILKYYLEDGPNPDNLAELYTNWSRAIYIDPNVDMKDKFNFDIVKLPEISHTDNFLEPMTLWRLNKTGPNKGKYTPRKHQENISLWRSFGAMRGKNISTEKNRQSGIIDWYMKLDKGKNPSIKSVTMLDDGNATSWMPIGQVRDQINMNHEVGKDLDENGWVDRISELVDLTQDTINVNYKNFVDRVGFIRQGNSMTEPQIQKYLNKAYFSIDTPFKEWLSNINPNDNKEETVKFWKLKLKKLIEDQAKSLVENASDTDYIGREDEKGKIINIPIAYETFRFYLNQKLK